MDASVSNSTPEFIDNMASKAIQGHMLVDDADLYSNVGLPDDNFFEPTSTPVKTTGKFQPKRYLQDTDMEMSKVSTSIANEVEHNNDCILPSKFVLGRNSDLGVQEDASNENTEDAVQDFTLPSGLGSLNNSEPSSTMDASPHFKESHSLYAKDNGHQEASTDNAHEFPHNISFHEPEFSNFDEACATQIEQPNDKESTIYDNVDPSDHDLEVSLSCIAHGLGKFCPKPKSGGLAGKLKQSRREVRSSDEVEDATGRKFESLSTSLAQEGHTMEKSGVENTSKSNLNKPVRRKKKASDASNSELDHPKKKFSHSTRRAKRKVDKTLLEMPQDEIDSRKLRLRDLILLSEARERMHQVNNEVAAALHGNASNDGPNSSTYYHDNDNNFAQEKDPDYEDEEALQEVDADSFKLNYHSYMKTSRREKWSKTDIELFYRGLRQFGTDFSMIQLLFPNKTRHQVHLKFKSEERKNPLQIADALVHRSKDNSCFKQVIEQLKVQEEKEKTEELASENFDDADAVVDEGEGVDNYNYEDEEINDMGYDGGETYHDDNEEAFNWDDDY